MARAVTVAAALIMHLKDLLEQVAQEAVDGGGGLTPGTKPGKMQGSPRWTWTAGAVAHPEVVYCPGKTSADCSSHAGAARCQPALATRATAEQFAETRRHLPDAVFHEAARAISMTHANAPAPSGCVAVVCAGTVDIPVAEEAAVTSEWMGARVERAYDVGVAGLHRLLRRLETLRRARALVAVAGMEGALPSVVAGLVSCPVVAVPTSAGYGAGLRGMAALMAMLNSCVPGVTVVNIDNGFGAGVAAGMINRGGV